MRFKRQARHGFEDTRRKRLAALRGQQRERDRFPLLAGEIAAQQPGVDQVMTDRAERWTAHEKAARSLRAAQWIEGRRRLAGLEPGTRAAALAYWNGHRWLPGDPGYLLDMLHSIETGRLVQDGATFRFARPTIRPEEAMQIEPTRKPPVLPGLTRPRLGGPGRCP